VIVCGHLFFLYLDSSRARSSADYCSIIFKSRGGYSGAIVVLLYVFKKWISINVLFVVRCFAGTGFNWFDITVLSCNRWHASWRHVVLASLVLEASWRLFKNLIRQSVVGYKGITHRKEGVSILPKLCSSLLTNFFLIQPSKYFESCITLLSIKFVSIIVDKHLRLIDLN
jgi:hypothetical protein